VQNLTEKEDDHKVGEDLTKKSTCGFFKMTSSLLWRKNPSLKEIKQTEVNIENKMKQAQKVTTLKISL